MAEHNEFGKQGEDIAREYLVEKGYQLIEQNWRKGRYEIDLVGHYEGKLIFIEVKSRNGSIEDISEVFSSKKEKSLRNAVNVFLKSYEGMADCRIDLIIIEKKNITFTVNHIEDAISP